MYLVTFHHCHMITSSLWLSPFRFSFRLLVRTCVHHHHILATCYLITRARPTLRTSRAEQIWKKHQSSRYATKAKHTRTVRHGEYEELIRSLTEALFTLSNADKSTLTQNEIPNIKKSVKIHFMQHPELFFLCFLLEYCCKGCSRRNLANTDLYFKRQCIIFLKNKGKRTVIIP